ncbi:MAG: TetR/AcrR family transcriptional regulator [Bradyrhizobiaceae bacterium]|nr:TetR/AcrR family transcriptional regulator [Bradyrhizobiaceae bacterium]
MFKAAVATPTPIPPRERILAAASGLFYRQGIRAVGVDAIAEAAGTNKMTLYRHFASKDELVAEYLRRLAAESNAIWGQLEQQHPGNPCAQLDAWLEEMAGHLADADERGCALTNAAVELPEKNHPARPVIEEFKKEQRARLAALCAGAGLSQPELVADELFLILEGARVSSQSVGPGGPACSFVRMGRTLIEAHSASRRNEPASTRE